MPASVPLDQLVDLALGSPERGELVHILETGKLLEWIVDSAREGGEGVAERLQKLHQVISWGKLHAFLCGSEDSDVVSKDILLSPAFGTRVEGVDFIHDFLHFFMMSCFSSKKAQERQQ